MTTAPGLLWRAAGRPAHAYPEEHYEGSCATCGVPCETGVATDAINNPTFSNHAEFFRYGRCVCRACAWLYGIGKGKPGNVLALGDRYVRPVISEKSADEERPTWLSALREAASLDPSTPVAGVLTTDTKPRVWPRMRVASVGDFGLYVHAPEYDTSVYRQMDLAELLRVANLVGEALALGYAKARVYSGLLADFARAKRVGLGEAMRLEEELRKVRCAPEFVPALVIGQKGDANADRDVAREPERAREARGEARQDHDRLF